MKKRNACTPLKKGGVQALKMLPVRLNRGCFPLLPLLYGFFKRQTAHPAVESNVRKNRNRNQSREEEQGRIPSAVRNHVKVGRPDIQHVSKHAVCDRRGRVAEGQNEIGHPSNNGRGNAAEPDNQTGRRAPAGFADAEIGCVIFTQQPNRFVNTSESRQAVYTARGQQGEQSCW